MTSYVALLRGVNVGGHLRVSSADLRGAADDVGLQGARTYANSGNLVAGDGASPDQVSPDDGPTVAPASDVADVAKALSAALARRVDAEVPLLVVSAARLAHLGAEIPFPEAARDDQARLQLHLGPEPVDPDGVARLIAEHEGPERIAVADGALYVHYTEGIGRSRLTSARLGRATGTWTTGRNWRTVTRLLAMAREDP